jgi:tight adherence protein B
MSPIFVGIAVFVTVSALIGSVGLFFRDAPASRAEDRLDVFANAKSRSSRESELVQKSVLSQPLDAVPGLVEALFQRFGDMSKVFEQADTTVTPTQLALFSLLLGAGGVTLSVVLRVHLIAAPLMGLATGVLPIAWLFWRRSRRMKAFAAQLPDAMDMLSRSLRAGQSLAAGFNLVSTEMAAPVSKEFGRVFEEQNLGLPLEDALKGMSERIPNLDLKFFATAVILQRQTGGDLAEILDKISNLVRERFRIWGQVQALTGEGRLSGIVLMILPPALLAVLYYLNRDYIMLLFTDPLGKKMLAMTIVLQLMGAYVINKIVTIKV